MKRQSKFRRISLRFNPDQVRSYVIEALEDRTLLSVYYVNWATGSDTSNNGLSSGAPFRTIQKALNAAHTDPSATKVEVAEGVYRIADTLYVKRGGSSTTPFVLAAADDQIVTIKGSINTTASSWSQHPNYNATSYPVWKWNGVWPRDFNSSTDYFSRNQFFYDNVQYQEVNDKNALTAGTFYVQNIASDSDTTTNREVFIWSPEASGAQPVNSKVEGTIKGKPLLQIDDDNPSTSNRIEYVTIRGLKFEHNANEAQADNATVQVINADHIVLDDINVSNVMGTGLGIKNANDVLVTNSTFNNNGQQGINTSKVTGLVLDGNTTNNSNNLNKRWGYADTTANGRFDPDTEVWSRGALGANIIPKVYAQSFEAGGFKISESIDVIVKNHMAAGNYGAGLWFDVFCDQVTVANNTAFGNTRGIHYEISTRANIFGNVVYSNEPSNYNGGVGVFDASNYGIGIFIAAAAFNNVYNNTVFNNGSRGIYVKAETFDEDLRDSNNKYIGIRTDPEGNEYNSLGNKVYNNIVSNNALHDFNSTGNNVGIQFQLDLATATFDLDTLDYDGKGLGLDYPAVAYNVAQNNLFHGSIANGKFFATDEWDAIGDGNYAVDTSRRTSNESTWQGWTDTDDVGTLTGDRDSIFFENPYLILNNGKFISVGAQSAALDKGLNVTALNEYDGLELPPLFNSDFHGTPRPSGIAIDIGATEMLTKEATATISGSSGDTYRLINESGASGGQSAIFESNAIGDYVIFSLNNIEAREYEIWVKGKTGSNRGTYQLGISGSLGGTYDPKGTDSQFHSSSWDYTYKHIGNVTFSSSGTKYFRFLITGKDALGTDYWLGIDNFRLQPV